MTLRDLIEGKPVKLAIRSGRHLIEVENCGPSAWLEQLNGSGGPWFRLMVDGRQIVFSNDPEAIQTAFREVARFASLAPEAEIA